MTRTIIYDSSERVGHQAEYIDHLINYLKHIDLTTTNQYVFVLHPNIIARLTNYLVDTKCNVFIKIISIPIEITSLLKKSSHLYSRYQNSKIEGKYLKKLIDEFDINKVIFMALDNQIMLAGQQSIFPEHTHVSGIYFRPLPAIISHHRSLIDQLSGVLKKYLKASLVRWLIKNPAIDSVFVPEDRKVIDWLSHHINSAIFKYLPDPITQCVPHVEWDFRSQYNLSGAEMLYLIFGAMEPRKNLINIIQAFSLFKRTPSGNRAKLLILGKFLTHAYKAEVLDAIETHNFSEANSIVIDDRFLANHEIEQIFTYCQVVLMPYLDCQGSSGVLGHSAKNRKPVIVADLGLSADLVQSYQLGYVVNPTIPTQIAKLMETALTYKVNDDLLNLFLIEKTPDHFAKLLLNIT